MKEKEDKYPARELREVLGLSRKELASHLGVAENTVAGWEGTRPDKNPSRTAIKLMESLRADSPALPAGARQ